MRRALACVALLAAVEVHGAEAVTVPKNTFVFDFGYLHTLVDKQWNGQRQARSLIEEAPEF